MIRVGLARCRPSYAGLQAPWGPGKSYPEIARLLGDAVSDGPENPVYGAVRSALHALGLDSGNYGSADWNPIGDLVSAGQRIVLKPNLIRHWNPASDGRGGSVDSVITHGAVIRAVADYAFIAAGPDGSVAIAEAPQMDCDFDQIRQIVGLDEIVRVYHEAIGQSLEVIDLRREAVVFRDGIIEERKTLPGDPAGYRAVDLGDRSFFTGSGLDPNRFRGADYDPGPTAEHHSGGRNAYLLSETVLSADLVINLPEAQDPQEDRRHARAQESRRDQRRQELAAASQPRLGRRGRRRVSREPVDRPPAQSGDRDRAAAARQGQGTQALSGRATRRERHSRRSVHPERQLVRQPHDLADVL